MNKIILSQIAKYLGANLVGEETAVIEGVAGIEEAKEGDLTFVSNPKYVSKIKDTNASAIILSSKISLEKLPSNINYLLMDEPYLGFCMVLDKYFNPFERYQKIEQPSFIDTQSEINNAVYIGAFAYVSEGAVIEENAQIYPHVFIGKNVKIGKNSVLYSGVKVYSGCEIGENCIIHSGTVIGSDGFGHAPMPDGSYAKIPQVGNVKIEDDVEIGANCTIDRATLGTTTIKKGTKLDNLIQIAHNVEVGKHTVIASQVGISGSTKIGDNCMIGGQVGFAGHIQIAKGSRFGAQTGVPSSIKEEYKDWMGTPAMPMKNNLKSMVLYKNLPDLEFRIRNIEEKLKL